MLIEDLWALDKLPEVQDFFRGRQEPQLIFNTFARAGTPGPQREQKWMEIAIFELWFYKRHKRLVCSESVSCEIRTHIFLSLTSPSIVPVVPDHLSLPPDFGQPNPCLSFPGVSGSGRFARGGSTGFSRGGRLTTFTRGIVPISLD